MQGFEFAAELTYPIDETLSSGILNASVQVFRTAFEFACKLHHQILGIVFTVALGYVQEDMTPIAGVNTANWILCGLLLIGSVDIFYSK